MGRNDHAPARLDLRGQGGMPVRQHAVQGDLERFGGGQLLGAQGGIARVEARVALVVQLQHRRRDIVTAPPGLDLRFPELLGRFGLVQSLQGAVVTLVQLPGLDLGDPFQAHFLQHDPQRLDGAAQHRGVSDVEDIAAFVKQPSCLERLSTAQVGQADVRPAGEAVLQVPCALSMTDQYQFVHRCDSLWFDIFSWQGLQGF